MELSAFYSLSNLYGKRAVGILRITDMPLIERHELSEKFAELAKKKREDSVNLIFEIILKFFKMI